MSGTGLRFAVLGPLRAWRDDTEIAVGSPLQRAVLALLLLQQGRPTSVAGLTTAIWADAQPRSGQHMIRTYILRLRRALGTDATGESVIRSVPGGYLLSIPPGSFDLHESHELVALADQARAAGDSVDAVRLFAQALDLWFGQSLSGVPGIRIAVERESLENWRNGIVARLVAVQLRTGDNAGALDGLHTLIDQDPLDESLHELQILALYRSGRPADALRAYADVQTQLADELGVRPGTGLQDLYQRILRSDPTLLAGTVVNADDTDDRIDGDTWSEAPPASTRLPAALPAFVGRERELDRADAAVSVDLPDAGVVIVTGTAGVGKTAFAVHWAHQLASRFPDGQLYLDLRGFKPGAPPVSPTDAMTVVLQFLGVTGQSMPREPGEMAALYRRLVADRRMVLLLDDARKVDQVRPLLLGTSSCLMIITSRSRLCGLVVTHGATPIPLGLPSQDEARALLAGRIGRHRVESEPDAANEIVELCAHLPLALAILAARYVRHPDRSLASVAAELRDSLSDRLDALSTSDLDQNMRAVFNFSYGLLTPDAARLYRLLSLHPGTDATAGALASLSGLPRRATARVVAELTAANLLDEHAPGRYSHHDLLRVHARVLSTAIDTEDDRAMGLRRLVDHYLADAHTAARVINPYLVELDLPPVTSDVTLPPAVPMTRAEALEWLTVELNTYTRVAEAAFTGGLYLHAWHLALILDSFPYRSGNV